MKKTILIVLGFLIIAGSFFPWYWAHNPGAASTRFFHNYFLGIPIHSDDSLLGFHGFPIVLGIVFIVSVLLLSKERFFHTVGIIALVIMLVLLVYDGIHFLVGENEGPQTAFLSWGYWITLFASVISLLLIRRIKKD